VEEVSRKAYTYNVSRDGRFWLIHVPELDRFTQARNLREVDEMVVDLISIVTDQPATAFDTHLGAIELPDSVAGHLDTAKALREQAARSQHDAAEEARKAARELSEDGVPLRDIGRLMGVSYQRAHQLVAHS
jgi:hypothetical protein